VEPVCGPFPEKNLNMTIDRWFVRKKQKERIFQSDFIIRMDGNSRWKDCYCEKRDIWKATKDAYPSLFLNTPGYLSSEPPRKRNAPEPEERQLHQSLRDEYNFQKWLSDDKLNSFDKFCLKLLHEENAATSHALDYVCIPSVNFIGL
jgi:hypothetical protein